MRRIFLTLICCGILIGGSACEEKTDPDAEGGNPRLTIAVIPKGTTHEFWKSIHAGAVKASRELDVDILWKGPLKEDDREAQIMVVESMIGNRVSGIVLAPLDDVALKPVVRDAAGRGIPVLVIDSGLQSDKHISFVATDNHRGGALAGEHLAKLLGGKGNVVMLRYQAGSASTMNREQGFLDAMKQHPEINIVSDNQRGGPTTNTSMQASEALLSRFKKGSELTIDGIFCPNESTTFGMLRVLQDSKYAGKVRFVGFDSGDQLVKGLEQGHLDGLILQDPFKMGYLGVKSMVEHLRGMKISARIDTGAQLVTRDNMSDADKKQLLSPDLSEWLGN